MSLNELQLKLSHEVMNLSCSDIDKWLSDSGKFLSCSLCREFPNSYSRLQKLVVIVDLMGKITLSQPLLACIPHACYNAFSSSISQGDIRVPGNVEDVSWVANSGKYLPTHDLKSVSPRLIWVREFSPYVGFVPVNRLWIFLFILLFMTVDERVLNYNSSELCLKTLTRNHPIWTVVESKLTCTVLVCKELDAGVALRNRWSS